MIQHQVPVLENVRMAERTFRLRLLDGEIGCLIRPGQFVMLRLDHDTDPLLARPFALYDTFLDADGQVAGYDLVYLVVGKVTARMSELIAGQTVEIWGPLGNGFNLTPTPHLAMVAGGIGQTPFPAVARAMLGKRLYGPSAKTAIAAAPDSDSAVQRISLCYGVRNAIFVAGIEDFQTLGVDIAIATDDGSAGHHGYVTDLVQRMVQGDDRPTRLMGCGPEPMMHTLARIAEQARIPCELSLETPMACGVGACFSCVAQIRQGDGRYDYRRVCVEGPVFDAGQVKF
jgi:dihydroorotate dehydrogenase electron transfer subunit